MLLPSNNLKQVCNNQKVIPFGRKSEMYVWLDSFL
jgi:hypothetical protein